MLTLIKHIRFLILLFVLISHHHLFSQNLFTQLHDFDGWIVEDISHHQTIDSYILVYDLYNSGLRESKIQIYCYDLSGQLIWQHTENKDSKEAFYLESVYFKTLSISGCTDSFSIIFAKYQKHVSMVEGYRSIHLLFDAKGEIISRKEKPESNWFQYYPIAGCQAIKISYNELYNNSEAGDCACTKSKHYNEVQFSLGDFNRFQDFNSVVEVSTPFWVSEFLYKLPVQIIKYQDSLVAGYITTADKELPEEKYHRELCKRDVVFWIDENRKLQTLDYGSNSIELRRRVSRIFEYSNNIAVIYSEAQKVPFEKSSQSFQTDVGAYSRATWDSMASSAFKRNPFTGVPDTISNAQIERLLPDSTSTHLVAEYNPASIYLSTESKDSNPGRTSFFLFSEEEYGSVLEVVPTGDSSFMLFSFKEGENDLFVHKYDGKSITWRRCFDFEADESPGSFDIFGQRSTANFRLSSRIKDYAGSMISDSKVIFYINLYRIVSMPYPLNQKVLFVCLSIDGSAIFPSEIKSKMVE